MKLDEPRYVAGLQDKKDHSCYKDFYESDKFSETKETAEATANDANRPVIIFDRKEHMITYRYNPNQPIEEEETSKKKKKYKNKIKRK